MPKPAYGSYPPFFETYIKQVSEDDIEEAFSNQKMTIFSLLENISEEKSMYAYAPGKWTLKEMLQHIIDTERIFNFRALSFARKEKQSLPGFDENQYAAVSDANRRSWKNLLEEFRNVRKSTELLFKSFTTEMLDSPGLANNKSANANVMAYTILGHVYHHIEIIEERYLLETPL